MRDILIRLREDAGQLTLAVLIQEREAAAWEIEQLRGQLQQSPESLRKVAQEVKYPANVERAFRRTLDL